MKQKSEWTKDERELDWVLSLMDSQNPLDRNIGRGELIDKFHNRFTPEQLAEMAESIGARKKR